jgi:hypothetical protein
MKSQRTHDSVKTGELVVPKGWDEIFEEQKIPAGFYSCKQLLERFPGQTYDTIRGRMNRLTRAGKVEIRKIRVGGNYTNFYKLKNN